MASTSLDSFDVTAFEELYEYLKTLLNLIKAEDGYEHASTYKTTCIRKYLLGVLPDQTCTLPFYKDENRSVREMNNEALQEACLTGKDASAEAWLAIQTLAGFARKAIEQKVKNESDLLSSNDKGRLGAVRDKLELLTKASSYKCDG